MDSLLLVITVAAALKSALALSCQLVVGRVQRHCLQQSMSDAKEACSN